MYKYVHLIIYLNNIPFFLYNPISFFKSSISLPKNLTRSSKLYLSLSISDLFSLLSPLNNYLFPEVSFLLKSICYFPNFVIFVKILVFSLFTSNNYYLTLDNSSLALETFLWASFSSKLNYALISKTALVGSKASSILRSIISPNLSICFSSYFLFKSSILRSFNLISFSYIFLVLSFYAFYFVIFPCSCFNSITLLQSLKKSYSVNNIDLLRSAGNYFWSLRF